MAERLPTSYVAPTTAQTPAAAPPRPYHIPVRLLGQGTWPLLLGADVAAVGVAVAVLGYLTLEAAFLSVALLVLLRLFGLYRSRLAVSLLDDLPRIAAGALGAASLAAVADSFIGWAGLGTESVETKLLLFAAVAFAFLVVSRAAAYAVIRHLRAAGIAHPTLILGAGRVGGLIAQGLQDHPEYGLRPLGFIDSDPLLTAGEHGLPILGGSRDLTRVLREQRIRAVIVAFSSGREENTIDVIRDCDRLHCEIFVVPRLFEVHHVSEDMDYAWGVPLVRLRRGTYRNHTWRLKRIFDVAFSALALVLLSPVLALTALAVRLEGGPGIIFRQERVGVDARRFQVLKFRSMRPVNDSESATNWNIAGDSRLGPVGRFIRRYSIDELPQLLNILRGDMSFVGPRPERPFFVAEFGTRSRATSRGTGSPAGSPAGPRSTACAATPRSRTAPASTTTTSRTGRSGSTSRSFFVRSRPSSPVQGPDLGRRSVPERTRTEAGPTGVSQVLAEDLRHMVVPNGSSPLRWRVEVAAKVLLYPRIRAVVYYRLEPGARPSTADAAGGGPAGTGDPRQWRRTRPALRPGSGPVPDAQRGHRGRTGGGRRPQPAALPRRDPRRRHPAWTAAAG